MKHINIKFCGGCNPRIARREIAEEVKVGLLRQGYVVSYNSRQSDFIVYLSGCSANCAERYGGGSQSDCVIIAAAMVEDVVVNIEDIAPRIIEKVRDYFE